MKPFLLWESVFDAGTLAISGGAGAAEDANFPMTNLRGWKTGRPYRFIAAANTTFLNVWDTLTVAADADTAIIGGHNFVTADCDWQIRWSATPPTSPTALLSDTFPTADNIPQAVTFTAPGAQVGWNLNLDTHVGGGNFAAIPELGILTVGKRLELPCALADMDAYGKSATIEDGGPKYGSPLGPNARTLHKRFMLDYSEMGIGAGDRTEAAFFTRIDTSFIPHAITLGKPFWYAWNLDVDPAEVWLCTVEDFQISQPAVGSYKRRGLRMVLNGWREV